MIQTIGHALARLRGCAGGNIAVEFALCLPIYILLAVGGVEVGRYLLLNQKLDRVASSVADLTARLETISEADVNELFLAAREIALPFDLDQQGRVVVSSVINPDGNQQRVVWQRTSTSPLSVTSRIGNEGGPAALDEGMTVDVNETVIVTEVFYRFEPLFTPVTVDPRMLYVRAHHRPRLGTLDTISND